MRGRCGMRVALIEKSELARGRLGRIARYGVVGAVSNLGLLAMMFLLLQGGIGAIPAAMLVYALGLFVTYFANKRWSFRSNASHSRAGPRYFLVHGVCALVVAAMQLVGHEWLGFDAVMVQVVAIAVVVIPLFMLMERFAFHASTRSPERV